MTISNILIKEVSLELVGRPRQIVEGYCQLLICFNDDFIAFAVIPR